jgi:branched-chain amino acid aminotransferase
MDTQESQEILIERSTSARTADERRALMNSKPKFGEQCTDHMVTAHYTPEKGWHDFRVTGIAPFEMHPATAVLHFGQAIFEGLKAYSQPDGDIALFRPEMNARRFQVSARRLAMPPVPEEMFLASVRTLAEVERDWVPRANGTSLYLRPMMFSRDVCLTTKPSKSFTFAVIASPAFEYFRNGLAPVSVWISDRYIRAAPGGTGEAKCAGNYAAGYVAQAEALQNDCEQVIWLDAIDRESIEEMGGMNVYFVINDGSRTKLVTPRASGSLLKGVTRDSLLTLAADCGYEVEERRINVREWREGCKSGQITEAFACGTAAVMVPIGKAKSANGEDIVVNEGRPGPVVTQLRERLLGIQHGVIPDIHGWVKRIDSKF